MLNNLPLIIVMILSLFLAFYCVDSHKDNIVTQLNIDEKNVEPVSLKAEENLTESKVEVNETVEKVYVEVLAENDSNETHKVPEEIVEKPVSNIVVEDSNPTEVEVKIDEKEVDIPIIEPKEVEKTINKKVTSEYSEGYQLDDLEKMIMEELKKGNKD